MSSTDSAKTVDPLPIFIDWLAQNLEKVAGLTHKRVLIEYCSSEIGGLMSYPLFVSMYSHPEQFEATLVFASILRRQRELAKQQEEKEEEKSAT